MKYLIKSKMNYPNSFIINKERIVFMANEEKILTINVAEKYPDHLILLKVIDEQAKPQVKVEMITEPAPIETNITEIKGNKPELITEPDKTLEIAISEDIETEVKGKPSKKKVSRKKKS